MKNQYVFKRHEIKYLITDAQKQIIMEAMREHMVEDSHGKNTLLSLYLDKPDYLLIRRSIEKPEYKEKVRIRSYGLVEENSDVFLEIKKKYNSVVYKRRIKVSERQALNFFDNRGDLGESQVAKEIEWANRLYGGLKPSMLLIYDREAYYHKEDSDFRVTFDNNILYRTTELNLHTSYEGKRLIPEGYSLMEVKTSKGIPLWMVRVLSDNKIYKTSFSKYGLAYKNEQKGLINYA